jgi:hypothetical protein
VTALLAGLWLAAAPAAAQGISLGPAPDLWSSSRDRNESFEPEPVAQALDLAFGATVWAQVRISTMGPVVDLTRLVRAGFYKLELIDLVLICAESGRPLQKAAQMRRKGASLSAIAKDYGLDYDRVHEAALAVEETVDREYLPRFPEKIPRRKRSDSWRQGPD